MSKENSKLNLELSLMKKDLQEIKKAINTLATQDKYIKGLIKRLSGELIQLQHEVDSLHNEQRRKNSG